MLTTSFNLAGLTLVVGAILCYCCSMNIWKPNPHATYKYAKAQPFIQWISLAVGFVMFCYGAASSVAIFYNP